MPKSKPKAVKAETRASTKQARVIELLQAKAGANIDALVKATDWQPHSVRAAISGLRKAGYKIELTQVEGKKAVYRITAAPKAA